MPVGDNDDDVDWVLGGDVIEETDEEDPVDETDVGLLFDELTVVFINEYIFGILSQNQFIIFFFKFIFYRIIYLYLWLNQ